jgi:light-independent protochlorophyllide reductase subunit B
VACAVVSAPVHVQDYPARYAPVMGYEGANVLFDTWVHPLMMGLEEHLIHMFRDDFEFGDGAGASHLGHGGGAQKRKESALQAALQASPVADQHDVAPIISPQIAAVEQTAAPEQPAGWTHEAETELKKIPFFVRGKARRNTERYAADRGLNAITVDTLYDAKAHFSR